jgi:hypothetical protein
MCTDVSGRQERARRGALPAPGLDPKSAQPARLAAVAYALAAATTGGDGETPKDDVTRRRRHVLLVDVTQAASEVSRLIRECRDLHLPVEPGVRDAATRWSAGAVLLEEVIP